MLPVSHRNNFSEWFHYWLLTVWSVLISASSHCNDCLEGNTPTVCCCSLWLNKSVVLTHAGGKMNTNHSFLGCIVKRVWLAAYRITVKAAAYRFLPDVSSSGRTDTHIDWGVPIINQCWILNRQLNKWIFCFKCFGRVRKHSRGLMSTPTSYDGRQTNKQSRCVYKSHTHSHTDSFIDSSTTSRLHIFLYVCVCRWSVRGEAVARRWDHHDQRWTCQLSSQGTGHRPRQVGTQSSGMCDRSESITATTVQLRTMKWWIQKKEETIWLLQFSVSF